MWVNVIICFWLFKYLGVLCWKIRICLDIIKIKLFILIIILKEEWFKVNLRGGEFVLEVDKFISIEVVLDIFKMGIVNVEVMERR